MSKSQDESDEVEWQLYRELRWRLNLPRLKGRKQKRVQKVNEVFKAAIIRLDFLGTQLAKKEDQIQEAARRRNYNADLFTQNLKLQRELLKLKTSPESREALIDSLRNQKKELQQEVMQLQQQILDLKAQIWPSPFFDAV